MGWLERPGDWCVHGMVVDGGRGREQSLTGGGKDGAIKVAVGQQLEHRWVGGLRGGAAGRPAPVLE